MDSSTRSTGTRSSELETTETQVRRLKVKGEIKTQKCELPTALPVNTLSLHHPILPGSELPNSQTFPLLLPRSMGRDKRMNSRVLGSGMVANSARNCVFQVLSKYCQLLGALNHDALPPL